MPSNYGTSSESAVTNCESRTAGKHSRYSSLAILTVLLGSAAVSPAQIHPSRVGSGTAMNAVVIDSRPRRAGGVLYRIDPQASPAEMADAAMLLTLYQAQHDDHLRAIDVEDASLNLGRITEEEFIAELIATGAVLFAEPDFDQLPVDTIPNDPLYGANQWQHPKIKAPAAWDLETGDGSVVVAICDTGVLSTHPDLAANMQLPGRNVVLDNTDTEPTNTDLSHNQHGTFVAGCVAAVGNNGVGMTGVCWNAKILPVKVSDVASGSASTADLAEAITWAADNGADLINVSYSGFESSTTSSAAAYARGVGALVFYAAGNDNQDVSNKPDDANFILVGSTDSNDFRSSFSNYGTPIDVVAPGTSVGSTTIDGSGDPAYAIGSGTSYACPITVGVAALMLSANSSLTINQLETRLWSTTEDLGQPGDDNIFGHGRVDASEAVFAAINGLDTPATVDTPANGSTLSGSSVTFTWSGGVDADFYRLTAGAALGQSDYFAQNTAGTSILAVNLPLDASTVHVRLWSVIDGDWFSNDYTYTAYSGAGDKSDISSPTPSSTLSDFNITFNWSAGNGVTAYKLVCGTAVAREDYYSSGVTNVTSALVETLPADGSTIYVRLYSAINGDWVFNDYTYTAFTGTRARATISTPSPGSTLAGASQVFTWSAGSGVSQYVLNIGSEVGYSDYFSAATSAGTSVNATGLPIDGSTVYVRLWSRVGGDWEFNDYTYTAYFGSGDKAEITSPSPSSTLPDFDITFNWSAGNGVTAYKLVCGTAVAREDYYSSGVTGVTSALVETLPADGSTIYVRLYSAINGDWVFNDYTYTAFTGTRARATISTPSPGSTLAGASQVFTWSAGSGVSQYVLNIGSEVGYSDYFSAATSAGTSVNATGLPIDGSTVYVRLWSRVGGDWEFNDYTYTAASP